MSEIRDERDDLRLIVREMDTGIEKLRALLRKARPYVKQARDRDFGICDHGRDCWCDEEAKIIALLREIDDSLEPATQKGQRYE